jgi:hypothetical protein
LAASISLAIGIVFALFPRNWMELWLATDPDGGSGFYELLMIGIFFVIAVGIALMILRRETELVQLRCNLSSDVTQPLNRAGDLV